MTLSDYYNEAIRSSLVAAYYAWMEPYFKHAANDPLWLSRQLSKHHKARMQRALARSRK